MFVDICSMFNSPLLILHLVLIRNRLNYISPLLMTNKTGNKINF
jgi:hypothetical protein